jgi:hypothetical protein
MGAKVSARFRPGHPSRIPLIYSLKMILESEDDVAKLEVWFLLLIVSLSASCAAQSLVESSVGTCAVVAIKLNETAALSIDSQSTSVVNGKRANQTSLACKAWESNGGIIAAMTGLATSRSLRSEWDSVANAKKWLRSLPLTPTPTDVDKALRNWSRDLIGYLTTNSVVVDPNREIASLIVIFRSQDSIYYFKWRTANSHNSRRRSITQRPRQAY